MNQRDRQCAGTLGSFPLRLKKKHAQRNRKPVRDSERWNTDSSFINSSGSEDSDSNWSERSSPLPRTRAVPSHRQYGPDSDASSASESDYDSDFDSGYCSIEGDADDRAEHYDDLLAKFRIDGPTLANHSNNTKNMIQKQEQKWNK